MSHTTDRAARAERPDRSGANGRTPLPRASVPAPPKRRRPALTALAVLLIVGGAALAGLLALRMDSREAVLVVSSPIDTGERITAQALSTKNVSGEGISVIPADQIDEVVNRLYARQTLYEGQLLTTELLRREPPLTSDQAQVGVPLASGKYPPGLRSGDAVRLISIGDSQRPSKALATGLVIDVAQSSSSGFGSDAKASVATIVVPQAVADQVVGATGSEQLGMALLKRGVGVEDAEITDLSGRD